MPFNDIKRGDIYYVYKGSFDSVGREQESGRPAIIVSNDANNKHSETVEIVWLTTKHKPELPTHVKILSAKRESTALCEQITTVDKSRLGDYVDSLTADELVEVEDAIAISLDLYDLIYPQKEEAPKEEKKQEQPPQQELLDSILKLQTERDIYKEMYLGLLGKFTG